MRIDSCEGHFPRIVEIWNANYFYATKLKYPYVSFVTNTEGILDFLISKIEKYNSENWDSEFNLSISFDKGAFNEWIGIKGLVPVITIKFLTFPHNIGRYRDKFSHSDERVDEVLHRMLFVRMKEVLKSWLEEYNRKVIKRIDS